MKLYEPAPPARKDELSSTQDGIAIIVDGDTCSTVVEAGMYAYIKNNTHGLAEGLYKNTSNSAFPTTGGTADGTVFEADGTGGLNALNAPIIVERQEVSISGTGSMREAFITIPNLHVGYKAWIIGSCPGRFDSSHFLHAIHQIEFGNAGSIKAYVEHNLNSDCPQVTYCVMYVKV